MAAPVFSWGAVCYICRRVCMRPPRIRGLSIDFRTGKKCIELFGKGEVGLSTQARHSADFRVLPIGCTSFQRRAPHVAIGSTHHPEDTGAPDAGRACPVLAGLPERDPEDPGGASSSRRWSGISPGGASGASCSGLRLRMRSRRCFSSSSCRQLAGFPAKRGAPLRRCGGNFGRVASTTRRLLSISGPGRSPRGRGAGSRRRSSPGSVARGCRYSGR